MGISFLFSFAFHFFSQWFVRPPQKTILPFCISLQCGWLWSLPPVQYHKPLFIALQALCLSDLIPWIYLSVLLYNCRDFIRSYLSGLVVFPTFFNLTLNLAIRSSWRDCCFPLYFILLLRFYLVLSFGICSPITHFAKLNCFYFYVSCRRCSMHPSSTSPLWKLELYGLGFPFIWDFLLLWQADYSCQSSQLRW